MFWGTNSDQKRLATFFCKHFEPENAEIVNLGHWIRVGQADYTNILQQLFSILFAIFLEKIYFVFTTW